MSITQLLAPALVNWQAQHGRHDLPWQHERSAYRVWVSEIMLQQTQVLTVIPYFERFMARFPDLRALADAALDEVLHLWTGLGYYARARNLQRAAQRIRDEFGGEFPREFADVVGLPGIGRSTAGAILALARRERHVILDGNVKRVLARVFAIEGSPATRAIEKQLWQLATQCTPEQHVDVYTQGIMDLGATVCTRSNPLCTRCPIVSFCQAAAQGRQHELPTPRADCTDSSEASPLRKPRRRERCVMLLATDVAGRVLLARRPVSGIWGGLWSLPQFSDEDSARRAAGIASAQARVTALVLPAIQHRFTHFDLEIQPLRVQYCDAAAAVADCVADGAGDAAPGIHAPRLWYDPRAPQRVGLPAPVKALIDQLAREGC